MDRRTSLYLDFLRFMAAFVVLLHHFSYERFSGGGYAFFQDYGHDAVIIFFVLSGYVIAYIADCKEDTAYKYTVARLARLYSVLLPVLIIGAVIDQVGLAVDPAQYAGKYADNLTIGFIGNIFFIQEAWFAGVRYGSNGPLWSIGYEFWYYVIFGLFCFVKNNAVKYSLFLAVVLLIGPSILLLFPIWLMGLLIYKWHKMKSNVSLLWSIVIFFSPVLFYVLFKSNEINILARDYMSEWFSLLGLNIGMLRYGQWFLSDYIIGLIVALNIFSSKYLLGYITKGVIRHVKAIRLDKAIRTLASMSFTLYLLHFPLLMFLAAIFDYDRNNVTNHVAVLLAALSIVWFVSRYTENKKHVFKSAVVYGFEKLEVMYKFVSVYVIARIK